LPFVVKCQIVTILFLGGATELTQVNNSPDGSGIPNLGIEGQPKIPQNADRADSGTGFMGSVKRLSS